MEKLGWHEVTCAHCGQTYTAKMSGDTWESLIGTGYRIKWYCSKPACQRHDDRSRLVITESLFVRH